MDKRPVPDIAQALSGALDWWREAGVDAVYSDEPLCWTEQKPSEPDLPPVADEPKAQTPAKPRRDQSPTVEPAPAPSIDRAAMPTDLAGFAQWWLTEPALAEGAKSARIAPRGAKGAALMVVVPEPEREDRDTLLGGPQGRLLDAMLAAMELDEAQVYRASVLPRHMPGANWDAIGAAGIGDVLGHHISLVEPKRLAIFGANILPLTGNDPPQGPADLRIFKHKEASIPLLACRSLAALLEQPRWKARVWQAWLDWTG